MPVIEIRNLKKYFGAVKAVDDISLSIEEGEIFGFLGPNGAGKTTTIRCLMDFIRPTAGEINILGLDAQRNTVALKEKIGYLSSESGLYDNWTGGEHLKFVQGARDKKDNLSDLLEKFSFDPKLKARYLSTGNRQKLGLIMALLAAPRILIMDEPTRGLDPLLQQEIYRRLQEFKRNGGTVFMSSHNLPEVERICDRVAIIKNGKLVAVESVARMQEMNVHAVNIFFAQPFRKDDFVNDNAEVIDETPDSLSLRVKGDLNGLVQTLSRYRLKNLEISHATLDEIFFELYQRDENGTR